MHKKLVKDPHMRYLALVIVFCVSTTLNCDNSNGFKYERRIGAIEFHSMGSEINVPDTVAANAPFTIDVVSYGGGCEAMDDTIVKVNGDSATVTPYDRYTVEAPDNYACVTILDKYHHTATLSFAARGTARVIINGRRLPEDTVIRVVRTVIVQ